VWTILEGLFSVKEYHLILQEEAWRQEEQMSLILCEVVRIGYGGWLSWYSPVTQCTSTECYNSFARYHVADHTRRSVHVTRPVRVTSFTLTLVNVNPPCIVHSEICSGRAVSWRPRDDDDNIIVRWMSRTALSPVLNGGD